MRKGIASNGQQLEWVLFSLRICIFIDWRNLQYNIIRPVNNKIIITTSRGE